MRRLCVAFDAWVVLREEARAAEVDLGAAAALTELAGAASVRIGIGEELRPVSEADVQQLRRTARRFELRMTPAQGTLKVALEVRPDAVVLTRESSEGTTLARPLASLLYGVTPSHPPLLIAVAAGTMLVALGATTIPAWTASRTDPAVTLREE